MLCNVNVIHKIVVVAAVNGCVVMWRQNKEEDQTTRRNELGKIEGENDLNHLNPACPGARQMAKNGEWKNGI